MSMFLFFGFFEIIRTILYDQMSLLIFVSFASAYLFLKFVISLKQNQEAILTIFWMGYDLFITVAHYYGNSGYFDFPEDSFYIGSFGALAESLVLSRIPKFWVRCVYSAYCCLVRAIVVPPRDKGLLIAQTISLIFSIMMDLEKEKNDKKLFSFYFNYKEQILKFKNLVAQDIPEGIIILSKDIKNCLFMNNYFKNLVEDKKDLSITAQLNHFCLKEDIEQGIINPSNLSGNPRTLLTLLQNESNDENRNPSSHTYLVYNKMSQNFIFEPKIIPLIWDQQPSIAIILNDITEQHTILNLKIADSEKDKIIATVSHELRTPLNSILGMIQIMMKKVQDQELLKYLSICQNSSNLLIGLVNSLLDLHQIRANKLKLHPEKFNLKQMLQDITDLFEYQCNQKGLYLKCDISPILPTYVFTDKNRLSQVFINLLGNALKFTRKGGISITAELSQEKDCIKFVVEDTGAGIKEENQEKLFKMFGKLEQQNEYKNPQGVGLGLVISDNLVALLSKGLKNGNINLESEYGVGSRFSFCVRQNLENALADKEQISTNIISEILETLEDTDTEALSEKIKRHTSVLLKRTGTGEKMPPSASRNKTTRNKTEMNIRFKSSDLSGLNKINSLALRGSSVELSRTSRSFVLIVDDVFMNIMVAEHLISSHNYRVKSVLSGQCAIDLIMNNNHLEEPIKLILMDCQMPEMDGYQTTVLLKKLFRDKGIPEIPIVALTANNTEEDKEYCRKIGMSDYLSKPLKDKDLVKVLDKYCKI